MALPQPVYEQLTRHPVASQGWSSQILMFTSTVFLAVTVLYVGVKFGYRPYIENKVTELNQQIQDFAKQIPQEEQSRAVSFYGQLANIKLLLDKHVMPSAVFGWIEQNTLPTVYYNRMSVNLDNKQIVLSVAAKSLADVTRQLQHFQSSPDVERTIFSNTGVSGGIWQFELTLTMKPKFFTP